MSVDGAGQEHVKAREHPLLRMERQTAAALRPYLDAFALTPSSRSRVKAVPTETNQSRLEQFNKKLS